MRFLTRCTAAAVAVVFAALACRAPEQSSPATDATRASNPSHGGAIVYDLEADPTGLDPTRNAWDPSSLHVAEAIFDTWAAFDAGGGVRPYLAERIDHDADFTHWSVRIRSGVSFHDGTRLDADAGMRMTNALRASLVTGQAATYITAVDKVDDLTVRLTMKAPWASFPALLTGQGGYVIAPAQLDDPEGPLHPIGTGPFQLVSWDRDAHVLTLRRNPVYWRAGLPYLDGVTFHAETDPLTRINRLQARAADVSTASFPADVRRLEASADAAHLTVAHDGGATETEFVMFNTAHAPLDDVRVRRALAYATDRDALAAAEAWSKDRLTTGPFAPGTRWRVDTAFPGYDPKRARALVQDYERDHGPIHFALSAGIEPAVLQTLAAQWAAVGITADVVQLDFTKGVLLAVGGNYDAILFRYFAAVDPDTLWHFWSGETIRPPGQISLNLARYGDAEIDRAIDTARASPDPATRATAYATVQRRFADQVPYLWLYRTDWVIATGRHVHDARNVTLPDGSAAMPFVAGVHRLTETWVDAPR